MHKELEGMQRMKCKCGRWLYVHAYYCPTCKKKHWKGV